jgi:hypothetical protein
MNDVRAVMLASNKRKTPESEDEEIQDPNTVSHEPEDNERQKNAPNSRRIVRGEVKKSQTCKTEVIHGVSSGSQATYGAKMSRMDGAAFTTSLTHHRPSKTLS